jgi:hypothetical protein
VANRAWSWPGMRDGLLAMSVAVLALVLGALAADALRPERPMRLVAANLASPQSKIVLSMAPDVETPDCQCMVPTTVTGRTPAHPAGQAVGTTFFLANDGDRRRDFMAMSAMIGRRHAATALTLQPYQLSLGPEDSAAGVPR